MNRFKDLEWSGPAWYKYKTDEDGYPIEFKIVHFHPLNLGSHAATEFTAGDFAKIMVETYDKHPSLKTASIGLIHSHNTMGAFFSATDTSTIEDMAEEWTTEADYIEKNKPVPKPGKQVTVWEGNSRSMKNNRKKAILSKKTLEDQIKINKLLDKNTEGNLSDVDLEAKLENLGLDVAEIMWLTDDMDYSSYGYGGYGYGVY